MLNLTSIQFENEYVNHSDRNLRYRRHTKEVKILNQKEIEFVCKYLINPTNSGIWQFKAKWLIEDNIIGEII